MEKPLRKWRSANDGINIEASSSASSLGDKLKGMVHRYVDKKRMKRRLSTHSRLQLQSSTSLASSSKTSLDTASPSPYIDMARPYPSPGGSDLVFSIEASPRDHRDSGFGGCSTPSGSSCTSQPHTPISETPSRFLFPSTSGARDHSTSSLHESGINSNTANGTAPSSKHVKDT